MTRDEIIATLPRFWKRIDFDGPIPQARPELGPCWEWTGPTQGGYGRVGFAGTRIMAHRLAYELLIGPLPSEPDPTRPNLPLTTDHLCRNHACVRPEHLEIVTHLENMKRGVRNQNTGKTHCLNGHPYDEANTHCRNGRRHCRACARERAQRNYVPRPRSAS